MVFAVLLLGYLFFCALGNLAGKFGVTNYMSVVKSFFFTPESAICQTDGRTNFVILGKGGAGHDAPDLTDVIIFVSVSHTEYSFKSISLPRDIWVPELRAKLNSVYYWGNQKREGGGLVLTKSIVEKIVGQPVHYGLVIDFNGFVKVIDAVGGINVNVERGFVDERYPIAGKENDDCGGDPEYKCRYETVKFDVGEQIMGGETALKFVRSRHAKGDEGTDLARGIRQEKVIGAIKDSILKKDILLSPKKILNLVKIGREYIETDFGADALSVLARRFIQSKGNIKSFVLPEEMLINPPKLLRYDNLYVFIPKGGDWFTIHEWVGENLKDN